MHEEVQNEVESRAHVSGKALTNAPGTAAIGAPQLVDGHFVKWCRAAPVSMSVSQ